MRLFRTLPAILATVFALAGCGGGSGPGHITSTARGEAVLRIAWPKKTRVIPANADRVVVSVTKVGDAGFSLSKELTRAEASESTDPTETTVTEKKIGGLDPGVYRITATAFADPVGSAALAVGNSESLVIEAGRSTPFIITMATELSRFFIQDKTIPAVFSPSEFYVDAQGATSDGTNRVTPTFRSGRTGSASISVTPQSATPSDLLLLPVEVGSVAPSLIQVSGTGGFSADDGPDQNNPPQNASTYRTTINYSFIPFVDSGTLRFDYYDFVDGALSPRPLKSFTATIQLNVPSEVKVRVDNLPQTFGTRPDSYRLTVKLKEQPAPAGSDDSSPGVTYDAIGEPGADTVNIPDVVDRNRVFKVSVKLQVLTDNAGFVDLAGVDDVVYDVQSPAVVSMGGYKTLNFQSPGSTFPSGGVDRDGKTYGTTTDPFSLKITIGGMAVNISPKLFTLAPQPVSTAATVGAGSTIVIASNGATADETATFKASFVRPTGGVQGPVDVSGTFSVKVKRNRGGISVGIG